MTINGTTIFAERTTALLNPRHESALAAFWKGRAATASLTLDCIYETITTWVADGGAIATARGELIDVERAEQSGSQFLHLETGALVDLGDGELLRSLETAFGEDPKRTMNRMLSKAERPTTRRTDRRLLSALFWMNVARAIVQFREDRAKAA